jgi:hypothetical protein
MKFSCNLSPPTAKHGQLQVSDKNVDVDIIRLSDAAAALSSWPLIATNVSKPH